MKMYKVKITNDFLIKLCDLAINKGLEVEIFDGNLQDNYIFLNTDSIRIGNISPRKYIIVQEIFVNEWTSELEMIMTDNDNLVDDYRNMFERMNEEILSIDNDNIISLCNTI